MFNRYIWCIETALIQYCLNTPTSSTDTFDVLKPYLKLFRSCSSLFNRYIWCIETYYIVHTLLLLFVQPIHLMYWNLYTDHLCRCPDRSTDTFDVLKRNRYILNSIWKGGSTDTFDVLKLIHPLLARYKQQSSTDTFDVLKLW